MIITSVCNPGPQRLAGPASCTSQQQEMISQYLVWSVRCYNRVLVFPDWLSPNMFCRLSYRAWDANDSGCPRWPQTNAMLEVTVTLPRRHFLERSMPRGQLKESANKTSLLPHCNDIQGGPFLMPQTKFWKQFQMPWENIWSKAHLETNLGLADLVYQLSKYQRSFHHSKSFQTQCDPALNQ